MKCIAIDEFSFERFEVTIFHLLFENAIAMFKSNVLQHQVGKNIVFFFFYKKSDLKQASS